MDQPTLHQYLGTSASSGTIALCGHCGRPVINQPAVWANGVPYHVECTKSPYAK